MSNKLTSSYMYYENHPITNALRRDGYTGFEIAYSNRSLDDYGWTLINCGTSEKDRSIFGMLLGYTIKDALKSIKRGL